MPEAILSRRRPLHLFAAAAAAAGLFAVWHVRPAPVAGRPVDTRGWRVDDLIAHLHRRGVAFEALPDHPQFQEGTYLTRTGKSLQELRHLPRNERAVAEWRGTVRCERALPWEDPMERADMWGPCVFSDGRFVFFGDPDMLREIQAALTAG